MKKGVFGIIKDETEAQKTVDHLLRSEFSQKDISIILPESMIYSRLEFNDFTRQNLNKDTTKYRKGNLIREKQTKAPEGGTTGAAAGSLIGVNFKAFIFVLP